jgi:hypothetical protein
LPNTIGWPFGAGPVGAAASLAADVVAGFIVELDEPHAAKATQVIKAPTIVAGM